MRRINKRKPNLITYVCTGTPQTGERETPRVGGRKGKSVYKTV